jgi:hypothetical protein
LPPPSWGIGGLAAGHAVSHWMTRLTG